MKKLLATMAIVALFVVPVAGNDLLARFDDGAIWQTAYTQDDSQTAGTGDVAMIIQYVGSEENGQVDGNGTGDVLLLDGDLGSEAADTDIAATGFCGSTAGTLDVSNAACDTYGELVDVLNSSSNWIGVLVDVLPDDDSGASALQMLDLGTPTDAKTPEGVALYVDTTASDELTLGILPFGNKYARIDIRNWTTSDQPYGNALKDQGELWKGLTSAVLHATMLFQDGAANDTQFYIDAINMGDVVENGYTGVTHTTYWESDPGNEAATRTISDFVTTPFLSNEGDRIWVRIRAGTNLEAALSYMAISGVIGKFR